jgi:hypothetical protein
MMKAHGIHQSSQPIRETSIASRPSKRAGSDAGTKSKKRKPNQLDDTSNTDTGDDDEGLPKIKPEPVKTETAETIVKEEPALAEESSLSSLTRNVENEHQSDETGFFNDFVHPSAFDQPVLPGESAFGDGFELEGYHGLDGVSITGSGNGDAFHDSILIAD